MGEYADMILDGDVCELCGQAFEEAYGYPKTCTECGGEGELWSGYDDD